MTASTESVSHAPPIRQRVALVARSWIDTPVFHRGRNRFGIDCIGLIGLVGIEAGAMDGPIERIDDGTAYPRLPNPEHLVGWLRRFLIPIEAGQDGVGDVVALSWGQRLKPAHLAIFAELEGRRTIIHALPLAKPPRVREQSFAAEWPLRVCSVWRFPKSEA